MTTPRRFLARESREAMLVTADNLDEVAEWCGGTVQFTANRERRMGVTYLMDERDDEERGLVLIGSVLVTDGHRWWDMGAEEFEQASRDWEEQG